MVVARGRGQGGGRVSRDRVKAGQDRAGEGRAGQGRAGSEGTPEHAKG